MLDRREHKEIEANLLSNIIRLFKLFRLSKSKQNKDLQSELEVMSQPEELRTLQIKRQYK